MQFNCQVNRNVHIWCRDCPLQDASGLGLWRMRSAYRHLVVSY